MTCPLFQRYQEKTALLSFSFVGTYLFICFLVMCHNNKLLLLAGK